MTDDKNHKIVLENCNYGDKKCSVKNTVELQMNNAILSSNNYNLSNLMLPKINKNNKNNFISSKNINIENEKLLSDNSLKREDINPISFNSSQIKNLALKYFCLKYYYFLFFILSCVSSGLFVYIYRILNFNFYPLTHLPSIPNFIFSTPQVTGTVKFIVLLFAFLFVYFECIQII